MSKLDQKLKYRLKDILKRGNRDDNIRRTEADGSNQACGSGQMSESRAVQVRSTRSFLQVQDSNVS